MTDLALQISGVAFGWLLGVGLIWLCVWGVCGCTRAPRGDRGRAFEVIEKEQT